MPGPNKAALLGAAVILASLALGDFLVLRPNRLAAGEGRLFWQAVPAAWAVLAALLWTGLAASAFDRSGRAVWNAPASWSGRGKRAKRDERNLPSIQDGQDDFAVRVAWNRLGARIRICCAATLALLLLWSAGDCAAALLAGQPDFARVSLGAGFWGAGLGALIAIMDAVKRRDGDKVPIVVAVALVAAATALVAVGWLDALSAMREYAARRGRFWSELADHLLLSAAPVAAACVLGAPLGWLLHVKRNLGGKVFLALNVVQTIPSLALFGLMIAPLALLSDRFPWLRAMGVRGVGWAPALIALTLYALLPVVRNVFAGFAGVDRGVVEAGLGMGMSRAQLLGRAELPLALPVILGGVRTALVQTIGNAAVAALIGAGGLGTFIFQGLGQSAMDLVLLGGLPTMLLAVLADGLLRGATALTAPRGLRP